LCDLWGALLLPVTSPNVAKPQFNFQKKIKMNTPSNNIQLPRLIDRLEAATDIELAIDVIQVLF